MFDDEVLFTGSAKFLCELGGVLDSHSRDQLLSQSVEVMGEMVTA